MCTVRSALVPVQQDRCTRVAPAAPKRVMPLLSRPERITTRTLSHAPRNSTTGTLHNTSTLCSVATTDRACQPIRCAHKSAFHSPMEAAVPFLAGFGLCGCCVGLLWVFGFIVLWLRVWGLVVFLCDVYRAANISQCQGVHGFCGFVLSCFR